MPGKSMQRHRVPDSGHHSIYEGGGNGGKRAAGDNSRSSSKSGSVGSNPASQATSFTSRSASHSSRRSDSASASDSAGNRSSGNRSAGNSAGIRSSGNRSAGNRSSASDSAINRRSGSDSSNRNIGNSNSSGIDPKEREIKTILDRINLSQLRLPMMTYDDSHLRMTDVEVNPANGQSGISYDYPIDNSSCLRVAYTMALDDVKEVAVLNSQNDRYLRRLASRYSQELKDGKIREAVGRLFAFRIAVKQELHRNPNHHFDDASNKPKLLQYNADIETEQPYSYEWFNQPKLLLYNYHIDLEKEADHFKKVLTSDKSEYEVAPLQEAVDNYINSCRFIQTMCKQIENKQKVTGVEDPTSSSPSYLELTSVI